MTFLPLLKEERKRKEKQKDRHPQDTTSFHGNNLVYSKVLIFRLSCFPIKLTKAALSRFASAKLTIFHMKKMSKGLISFHIRPPFEVMPKKCCCLVLCSIKIDLAGHFLNCIGSYCFGPPRLLKMPF